MRSNLTAADYCSEDIFAAEQARIFSRLWILAGFSALVESQDAFFTHSIGGMPIFVQNTRDGLRAFVNQCAHRQSPIHVSDFGQRRIACPYHGWVYGDDGRVKSIPGNEANYGFCAEVVSGLGLRQIPLVQVGGLLFVNLQESPPPLEAQFNPEFLAQATAISSRVGTDALFAKFEGRYNWKLNFENVVDWNHVPFVHSGSFASLMPGMRSTALAAKGSCGPPSAESIIDDDIRALSYVNRAPFEFPDWPWHGSVETCGPTQEYINVFIYPNVNYVVMAGAIHLVQQFVPQRPDRTNIRLTMALGRRVRRLPAAPAILWSQLRSEKRVIDEDVAILEGLQRGHGVHSQRAFHGAYEYRLRSIAKVYRRLMSAP